MVGVMSKETEFSLSLAEECDSGFAYMVKKVAFKDYADKVWGWDEKEQRNLHEARYASQEFRILRIGKIRVGVTAREIRDDCINLNQLYILPEYQSKQIGGMCMRVILHEAEQLSLPVRLQVLKINSGAQGFYQRIGFVKTGDTETHVVMEWNS
jgi:ribosomal protein S18 acetylase RimI-like enzyme